jgi:putative modified peptide
VPEITVNITAGQQEALSLAKRLARDDDFRAQVAADPAGVLAKHGINVDLSGAEVAFSPVLPPKHVIEEALVNITEASEFASDAGFESTDPLSYWLFVIFLAT